MNNVGFNYVDPLTTQIISIVSTTVLHHPQLVEFLDTDGG